MSDEFTGTPFEDKERVETLRIKGLNGDFNLAGNFFERVGGSETFKKLVDKFYEGVAGDDVLRAMYPEDDLGPAAERLQLFLEQYWGGPTTYQEERGHPRLRMRHNPYKINQDARQRWLDHMTSAVNSLELPPAQHELMMDYLTRAATAMLNTYGE